jgi:hypothetical protein
MKNSINKSGRGKRRGGERRGSGDKIKEVDG